MSSEWSSKARPLLFVASAAAAAALYGGGLIGPVPDAFGQSAPARPATHGHGHPRPVAHFDREHSKAPARPPAARRAAGGAKAGNRPAARPVTAASSATGSASPNVRTAARPQAARPSSPDHSQTAASSDVRITSAVPSSTSTTSPSPKPKASAGRSGRPNGFHTTAARGSTPLPKPGPTPAPGGPFGNLPAVSAPVGSVRLRRLSAPAASIVLPGFSTAVPGFSSALPALSTGLPERAVLGAPRIVAGHLPQLPGLPIPFDIGPGLGRVAGRAAEGLKVPAGFIGVALLFALIQALIDRRDPKLAAAPEHASDDSVGFG